MQWCFDEPALTGVAVPTESSLRAVDQQTVKGSTAFLRCREERQTTPPRQVVLSDGIGSSSKPQFRTVATVPSIRENLARWKLDEHTAGAFIMCARIPRIPFLVCASFLHASYSGVSQVQIGGPSLVRTATRRVEARTATFFGQWGGKRTTCAREPVPPSFRVQNRSGIMKRGKPKGATVQSKGILFPNDQHTGALDCRSGVTARKGELR